MFDLIVAYLRERIRVRVFVPLALILAFAGWLLVPGAAFDVTDFLAAATRAFVLSLAFRVWDDLEDRPADRVRHPERVMSRSTRTAPFLIVATMLAVAGMTSLFHMADPLPRLIAIAAAVGVLSLWYSTRRSENWNRVAGGHLALLKYPLIAFAAAPALPSPAAAVRAATILAALYVVICVYEYVDDPELRHAFLSRRSLP